MVDREVKLVVDDLIVEYMILKVQLGYKPSYTIDEFELFLKYFQEHMNILGVVDDYNLLFDDFFERKRDDWSIQVGSKFVAGYDVGREFVYVPHIERRGDTLFATNKLSDYDYSMLNIKYMSKKEEENIRKLIVDYLGVFSKRKDNVSTFILDEEKKIGEIVAALFVNSIWNEYVKDKIMKHQWPYHCKNIDEYLLNVDLAKIIKLPSIRDELLSFYRDVSKRVASLLHNDPRLEICNLSNPYLPYSNYMSIMDGYNKILGICSNYLYGVSISDNVFVCNCDKINKYSDSVITKLDDRSIRELVKKLNRCC